MTANVSTATNATASNRGQVTGQLWVLVLVSAAQLLLQLDFSIVNVALPAIQHELGFTAAGLQWIVTGYAVTYGALLLLAGKLGDLFGHRSMLVLGLILFGLASLAGGLATGPVMLVIARLVQGAGASLVAPAALAALTGSYPGDGERAHALGVFQAATAGGATAGIVLGGVLVQFLGWRSVLLVNPPIIVVLVILILMRIPAQKVTSRTARLDVTGTVLVTAALAALVGGMSLGEQQGFAAPATIVLLTATAVLAIAFVAVQLRSSHPMLPRELFASRMRVGALVVVTMEFAIVVGYVYFISLYLQRVAGFSPLLTGISLVPATAIVMLTSMLLSRRLLQRLGVRTQLTVGLVFMAFGQATLSLLGPHSSYLLVVIPGLVLTAFGMGLSIPAAAFAANSEVPASLRGTAGGLFVTAQQAGAAIGLAVLATIAASVTGQGRNLSAGFDLAYLVAAGIALAAAVAALVIIPTAARARRIPASA